jgi:hypothetical protein
MIFSKLTIGFIAGVLLGTASVGLYGLDKIGVAYERGRYSVFYDCAKSSLSTQGPVLLVCKAINGDVQVAPAPKAPGTDI